ncbi:mitochondrial fission 1 protein [Brevipalpus obovatus]|uniref:mitochondrial fission 1 protein n=1 Tax=Brevipalpus obovatus TaxID=246614 RepID=UPI003D9E63C7
MEALLTDFIPPESLREFEQKYLDEKRNSGATDKTRFEYAWALIRSKFKGDVRRGIDILEELAADEKSRDKRDFLYYLAVANTKIGEYDRALDLVNKFLQAEPQNRQATELKAIIKERIKKDGLKGAAIAGGAALVVGGLVTLGLALSGRRN